MEKFEVSYRSNKNVVYSCTYHVVWCPKYRRPVITDKVETRLKEVIKESCIEFNADLIEMEVMPDHVHLLVQVDPQFGIHRLIKKHQRKILSVFKKGVQGN
jgi:putative transposase